MTISTPPAVLDRDRFRDRLRAGTPFDAIVIGGGITGAGTFRELAVQGLDVALFERGDFAGGASGALTRVAQGGFRYLERGDIGLVARAVIERNRIAAALPHLVRPIRVVIPTETRFGGIVGSALRFFRLAPGRALPGLWPLAIAVLFYEALSARERPLPRGRIFSASGLSQRYKGISTRYRGAVSEFEGLIAAPERVPVELLEDGIIASPGSVALNYAAVTGVEKGAIVVRDVLSGEAFGVRAPVIVNAGGAHVDRINSILGVETRYVEGIAGTHLFLCNPALAEALGDDLLFFEDHTRAPEKRRLCCAYAADGHVLVGATETPVADPDRSSALPAEDDYLLAAISHLFPAIAVNRGQIVRRLNGVRPLLKSAEADVTSRSREHALYLDRPDLAAIPVLSIAGGKWTTFRAMAEQAADKVLDILNRERRVSTRALPIGGGRNYPASLQERQKAAGELAAASGLDKASAERLLARYGSRAARVAAFVAAAGAGAPSRFAGLLEGEVRFFQAHELAVSDEDIRWRRRPFLDR